MSGNVKITLVAPTTRQDGSPFLATDLKDVLVESKASAATVWSAVGTPFGPTETTRTVSNLAGGSWDFRATWRDVQGNSGTPALASIAVPLSGPNAGTITLAIV